MRYVTGKWEFEIAPGRRKVAEKWVARMMAQYRSEVGEVIYLNNSPASNGLPLDDSVKGWFQPHTSRIIIFYSEENDLASVAEELAHYFQYQAQGLLGRTEIEIGARKIDANERAMREIMLANGFHVRR